MRTLHRPLIVATLIAAAISCGDHPTDGARRIATQFTIIAGDEQQATVGTELPDPIVVQATDAEGRIVTDAVVNFVVTAGGGSVFAPAVTTNAEGMVSNRWTLGPTAGPQTLEVRAIDATGSPVTYAVVEATALAGAPASITRVSTDGLSGVAGSSAPESLTVQVADQHGNVLPGVTVTWTLSGGGVASPPSSATDAEGIARTLITLPPTAGTSEVTVSVSGLQAQTFQATARAGSAAQIARVSGDAQQGTVGSILTEPLVVRVTDANGNPVAGTTVSWTTSGGALSVASPTTDEDGEATASWTLGTTAGSAGAVASVTGVGSVVFTASATAGPPRALAVIAGNEQSSTTGAELPQPLVVEVRDIHENPVGGVPVSWVITAGGGRVDPAAPVTSEDGRASATWILGATVGTQSVLARVVDGAGQPIAEGVFSATASVPSGATLTAVEGDGSTVVVGDARLLTARVTDEAGEGVTGVTVTWRITTQPEPVPSGLSLDSATSVTDATGHAGNRITAGNRAGTAIIEASAPGATPAVFTLTIQPGPIIDFRTGSDFPQEALAGTTITFDLEYIDTYGNAVPHDTLTWRALPGVNGRWSSVGCGQLRVGATNERGVARATWQLCGLPPWSAAFFYAGAYKPTITIPVLGVPMTIAVLRADVDFGRASYWIQITDADGRAGGPLVTATITSGSGTLGSLLPSGSSVSSTDSLTLTPDHHGLIQLDVERADPEQPVTVTVSAPGYASLVLQR